MAELQQLPEELLPEIFEHLEPDDLRQLSFVSRWCYRLAAPLIWRDVELVDCSTPHAWGSEEHDRGRDEHDDTPLLKKLIVLATNPWLASCVHTLTHRCHLVPPAIFDELPFCQFTGQNLSTDPRTIELVKMAAKNMKHVHTLRVILGHATLTEALLRCFFDKARHNDPEYSQIRRVWLENCRINVGLAETIASHPYGLPLKCDFSGLESIRLRRLPFRASAVDERTDIDGQWSYCRGERILSLQDDRGGDYFTTIAIPDEEIEAGKVYVDWLQRTVVAPESIPDELQQHPTYRMERFYALSHLFDDRMWDALGAEFTIPEQVLAAGRISRAERCLKAYRGCWLHPFRDTLTEEWVDIRREKIPSGIVAISMLRTTSTTLTSLCLDWVLSRFRWDGAPFNQSLFDCWWDLFVDLMDCRFPNLRSFQLRNGVLGSTMLPRGLYLFDYVFPAIDQADYHLPPVYSGTRDPALFQTAGLRFMEAHPKLRCLAWPITNFFSHYEPPADIAHRVEAVIANLGNTLVDLRVDIEPNSAGESQSEEIRCPDPERRVSRIRFITQFAARMRKLESIKIEGGMPNDERREILRALRNCPLNKVVMIGILSTIGNSWGMRSQDAPEVLATLASRQTSFLEAEDEAAIFASTKQPPHPPRQSILDDSFEPEFGWTDKPPMIHTLASYHASTITELKFCGFMGASLLFEPTPITAALLSPLKHFHKLESIITAMWISTIYEHNTQDDEVIDYWFNTASSSSTAVVHLSDDEPEGWEKELRTKYAPKALAWRITSFLGPFLSEKAKARKGGIHVRAPLCVGARSGIYDLDVWIGKGSMGSDVCKRYVGPRVEQDQERRIGKLNRRRWF